MTTSMPRRHVHLRRTATAAVAVLVLVTVAAVQTPTRASFTGQVVNSTNTVGTAEFFRCSAVAAGSQDSLVFSYALDEPSGSSAARDRSVHGSAGTYEGTMTSEGTGGGACASDGDASWRLDGSTSYLSTSRELDAPKDFTLEVWAKTTERRGKLIGFESSRTGASDMYDRHLWISTSGNLLFGTYHDGGVSFLQTGEYFPDGRWHHVVATFSSRDGSVLYLDGRTKTGWSDPGQKAADGFRGYWRLGTGSLDGWPGTSGATSYSFDGSMRYAAVYDVALTPQQVQDRYVAGTG